MNRFAHILETVPVPCRILGTALRPFSLGHHVLFAGLRLPYADNPAADGTALEFLQAVFVCAHSYEETLEGQFDGTWAAAFEHWQAAVMATNPDFAAGQDLFRRHLLAGYRMAPVWRHISRGDCAFSAPWEMLLKVRLVTAGFTVVEVMNGYLPERWYDYFTAMELRMAETITDPKHWKRIFYTFKDAVDDEAAKGVGA